MVQTIVVILGGVVMLIVLAGFLRGLWAPKPQKDHVDSTNWSPLCGLDDTGHSGDGNGH